MKIGSLKEVDAWSGGAYLGIGTHPAEIISASEGKSSGGHDQFEMEWQAIDGPEKGGTIKEWLVVIPSTLGKVKGLLESCGVENLDAIDEVTPEQLKGLKAAIVVRKENPDDKYPRVIGYRPLSELPVDSVGASGSKDSTDNLPF